MSAFEAIAQAGAWFLPHGLAPTTDHSERSEAYNRPRTISEPLRAEHGVDEVAEAEHGYEDDEDIQHRKVQFSLQEPAVTGDRRLP